MGEDGAQVQVVFIGNDAAGVALSSAGDLVDAGVVLDLWWRGSLLVGIGGA